jgi:hypothetical protein
VSPGRHKGGRGFAVAMAAVLALAVGGLVALVRWSEAPPSGPAPVAWDREACAHCRMHLGERGFAAQLQLRTGRVLHYDDPGCLFRHIQELPAEQVHAMYFHHLREERWLSRDEVAFVEVSPTPMGFGLGAVEKGTPGALTFEAAVQRVLKPSGARQEHSTW